MSEPLLNPQLGLLASLCSQLALRIPLSTPQALELPVSSHVHPVFTGFWGSENSGFQAYTASNLPTSPSSQPTPTHSFYICLLLPFIENLKGLHTNLIMSQASIACFSHWFYEYDKTALNINKTWTIWCRSLFNLDSSHFHFSLDFSIIVTFS